VPHFLKNTLPPTPSQMVHWVAEHPNLGAASSLAALGFDVSLNSVSIAAGKLLGVCAVTFECKKRDRN
jgi:hypothetical protein